MGFCHQSASPLMRGVSEGRGEVRAGSEDSKCFGILSGREYVPILFKG
jgi:hypothetical protein